MVSELEMRCSTLFVTALVTVMLVSCTRAAASDTAVVAWSIKVSSALPVRVRRLMPVWQLRRMFCFNMALPVCHEMPVAQSSMTLPLTLHSPALRAMPMA